MYREGTSYFMYGFCPCSIWESPRISAKIAWTLMILFCLFTYPQENKKFLFIISQDYAYMVPWIIYVHVVNCTEKYNGSVNYLAWVHAWRRHYTCSQSAQINKDLRVLFFSDQELIKSKVDTSYKTPPNMMSQHSNRIYNKQQYVQALSICRQHAKGT